MTPTIEIPDETAERARQLEVGRGVDLGAFATAAIVDVIDSVDGEPDWEVVAAGLEAIEDARAGRLLTLERVDAHVEAALAHVRSRREVGERAAPIPVAA